jgi:CBS domain-containing protein
MKWRYQMASGKSGESTVRDIMDTAFISLDEKTLVADAAKSMYETEGDTIIVTRTDPKLGVRIPVGIVTQRDLIYRVISQNKGPFKVDLGSIMNSPVTVLHQSAPVKKALEMMKEHGFSRLPIVTKTGEIVGLVTMQMVVRKLPLDKLGASEA